MKKLFLLPVITLFSLNTSAVEVFSGNGGITIDMYAEVEDKGVDTVSMFCPFKGAQLEFLLGNDPENAQRPIGFTADKERLSVPLSLNDKLLNSKQWIFQDDYKNNWFVYPEELREWIKANPSSMLEECIY